jgi:hypothetical protein
MRLETIVTVSLNPISAELLTEAVDDLLPGAEFESGRYQIRFHHASESLAGFLAILNGLGILYDRDESRLFSEIEIKNAAMLRIVPQDDRVTIHRRSTNDDPPCGHTFGGESTGGSLYIPGDGVGHLFRPTSHGGALIDEELASAFIREHIHGGVLRPVNENGGKATPYFVLLPQHRLPPMQVPPTRVSVNPDDVCPHCGQGGLTLKSLPFYGVDLDVFEDVNLTFERFRHGEDVTPEIVISQKVYRILEKHLTGKVAVEPVMLV